MYQRHKIWEEDKLDIHSTGSGISGIGSGSGSGYAGHSSKEHTQEYHKNEVYGAINPDGDRIKDDYRSAERQTEEKKKEDEDKEKTIADTVKQEEKYIKGKNQEEKESKESKFHTSTWDTGSNNPSGSRENDSEAVKSKNNKSIEDAIKEAIKDEKKIAHVD